MTNTRRRIAAARMVLGMTTLQTRLADRDGEWSLSDLFNDIEASLSAQPSEAVRLPHEVQCARDFLDAGITHATGALAKTGWRPDRAHFEGLRNHMLRAQEYLDTALKTSPSPNREAE